MSHCLRKKKKRTIWISSGIISIIPLHFVKYTHSLQICKHLQQVPLIGKVNKVDTYIYEITWVSIVVHYLFPTPFFFPFIFFFSVKPLLFSTSNIQRILQSISLLTILLLFSVFQKCLPMRYLQFDAFLLFVLLLFFSVLCGKAWDSVSKSHWVATL